MGLKKVRSTSSQPYEWIIDQAWSLDVQPIPWMSLQPRTKYYDQPFRVCESVAHSMPDSSDSKPDELPKVERRKKKEMYHTDAESVYQELHTTLEVLPTGIQGSLAKYLGRQGTSRCGIHSGTKLGRMVYTDSEESSWTVRFCFA